MDCQSGKECSLPNGVVAIKENTTIRLYASNKSEYIIEETQKIEISKSQLRESLEAKNAQTVRFGSNGEQILISVFEKTDLEMEIPRKTYTKWLDYDKIKNGFCIRTRQSGDYLIYDTLGHRKKLKQYFVDEKIPVTKRDEIVLLAQDNQVLWVVGGRISEHVKVTEQTHTLIEITYKEET